MTNLLHWTPRIIAIAAILFISMFALDVFEPGAPWPDIATALFMHLLPSFVLIAILAVAWRNEGIGGVLFLIAGLSPFFLLANPNRINLMIGGPFLLAGAMFLANAWLSRHERDKDG